jgi:hypothetical protein
MSCESDFGDQNRNRTFFYFLLVSVIAFFLSAYTDVFFLQAALIVFSLSVALVGVLVYMELHLFLYKTGVPIIPAINYDITCARNQYEIFFKHAKSHIQMVSGLSPKFYDTEMIKLMKKALDRGVKIDILLDNSENRDVIDELLEHPNLSVYLLPSDIQYDFAIIDGKKIRVEDSHTLPSDKVSADNSEDKQLVTKFEEFFSLLWSKMQKKEVC